MGEAGTARRPRKIDFDYAAKVRRYDLYGILFSRLIPWSGASAIMFFAWRIVQALAGKATTSQIIFGVLADVKTSAGIAKAVIFLFGASGIGYGIGQRRLRRKDIQSRSDYLRQLEEKFDSNRTSSRLTRKGTTPPEGRI